MQTLSGQAKDSIAWPKASKGQQPSQLRLVHLLASKASLFAGQGSIWDSDELTSYLTSCWCHHGRIMSKKRPLLFINSSGVSCVWPNYPSTRDDVSCSGRSSKSQATKKENGREMTQSSLSLNSRNISAPEPSVRPAGHNIQANISQALREFQWLQSLHQWLPCGHSSLKTADPCYSPTPSFSTNAEEYAAVSSFSTDHSHS